MAADYKRINRLLRIYTLIQGNQGWTAKRLAEEFKTTERTIFRDIDVLKSIDIPLHHDPEKKCYTIRKDFFMPPVELTLGESLALVTLGLYLRDEEQIPFTQSAVSALAKIRSHLPQKIINELGDIDSHMTVKLAAYATQEGVKDLFGIVQKAIATRKCLRCRYQSVALARSGEGNNGDKWFMFKPYALCFNQRAWYAVGYHGSRDEIRAFKLNRFCDMQPTYQTYEIPKTFSLERHLGNAWRMIRGDKTYQVELRFDAEFAETISDTVWHRTQEFEHEIDGSLLYRCTVDGLDEIVWWILGMGAHCKVLQPPELVQRVRQEAGQMLALYAGLADGVKVAPKPKKVN